MSRLRYRPEIDGLRAIAVIAVVLFHTQLRCPGGFVGVDIFFVISGFLITALIHADVLAGNFSLRRFWERRIRRIMPAATVTVVATLVVGYLLFLPSDFERLGWSAVSQAFGAANFFFYASSGYFSPGADSQPLLHFWSLAVEEQFYLLFPFVFLILRGTTREPILLRLLASLVATSFVVSAVGAWQFPDATFYLLPTRCWELGLGALLALRGGELPLTESARKPAGWVGVALMVGPMFLYNQETPFPGIAALPPCLGATLVIWSTAGRECALKRLLSWKPLVGVGLISYSLYLWHWPLMVYSHYWYTGIHSPMPMRALVLGVSFVLAWLSWRYVELPFRTRTGVIPQRFVVVGAAAAICVVSALGYEIARFAGLPGRFPPQVAGYDAAYQDRPDIDEADLSIEAAEAGELPVLNPEAPSEPTLLLWGDSHARAVSPAFEAMCVKMGVKGYRASHSATAPLLEWNSEEMRRYNAAVFRWIAQRRPTWVVLASRWEKVLKSAADERSLHATIIALQAAGVKVAIMRQVASQRRDIPKALARATLLHEPVEEVGVQVSEHAMFTQRSNEMIDRVTAQVRDVRVLDPIPYLSRNGRCLAEESGHALYYDYQHLTRFGALFLTPMFQSLVESGVGPASEQRNNSVVTRHDAGHVVLGRGEQGKF